jgi:hypothetical protein
MMAVVITGGISKIAMIVRRCIDWPLGSSNADDLKNAVLRHNGPYPLIVIGSFIFMEKEPPHALEARLSPLVRSAQRSKQHSRETRQMNPFPIAGVL